MPRQRRAALAIVTVWMAVFIAACSPAATTTVPSTQAATQPVTTPAPLPTQSAVTPTPAIEEHIAELEWPPQMRLGESDLIRLSLIPSQNGYVVTTEFAEHAAVTSTVSLSRPAGYDLLGVAQLDGAGFDLSPQGEQAQSLAPNQIITWRWTLRPLASGQQRLAVTLRLRWVPQTGQAGLMRQVTVVSRPLTVQVVSFFGLTPGQAAGAGIASLVLGSVFSLPLAAYLLRPAPRRLLRLLDPRAALIVEAGPGIRLTSDEENLLRALFNQYARVVLAAEFRSGYSGARTFLALPLQADGRADAYTIAKLGERAAIQHEFNNYEAHVKNTLPPITARIQETPVTTRGAEQAALRYTFIGEPGQPPRSLRESLLADPDPALLEKLFATFGPNWWMQRRPHTFRLAQEYDRLLPAHVVLKPARGPAGKVLDGRAAPADVSLRAGEVVSLRHFRVAEQRADGRSLSLAGEAPPGQPPVRVRWHNLIPPQRTAARVAATREMLLRELVADCDLFELSDPLPRLPVLLDETISGTRSTIHGDLNLENILIGPGGLVWLIDFARTREGHPLFDFAHLAAEIVAQVLAPQFSSPGAYLAQLRSGSIPLLATLESIAARCLFNPSQPREYHLALYATCLGALKFTNLTAHQRHLLYLTAAFVAQSL